jgi:hypothetical protein
LVANWPSTLRISPEGFIRAPFTDVEVERSRAGGRIAIDWGGDGIRWEFTVKTVGDTERSALETHYYTDQRGRFAAFNFTCPRDGDTHLVQYDMDRLEGQQEAPDVVYFRISLVTVSS